MNQSIIITLLAALMLAACTSTPKSYTVEGVVPYESYNNQMVYMVDVETMKSVDSALIVDEKFTFTGLVDTAVIRQLRLDRNIKNLMFLGYFT